MKTIHDIAKEGSTTTIKALAAAELLGLKGRITMAMSGARLWTDGEAKKILAGIVRSEASDWLVRMATA